jgi:hypothetical protein
MSLVAFFVDDILRSGLQLHDPWSEVTTMQILTQIPLVYGAIEYSLLYMLFGGGIVGAGVIFVVAKALNK